MELKIQARKSKNKSEINRIRREGDIPAVVYSKKGENKSVTISGPEFHAHLRSIEKGCLATQFFHVIDGKEKYKALIKEITYCRTTYAVQHIDLMKVEENDRIMVNVPVLCKGVDECKGIAEGGQLKRAKRSVPVSLKVSDMPKAFVLDVSNISLGGAQRVRDLPTTPDMKVKLQDSLIVVSVAK